ncbi:bacteriocin immunity protein [Streptomyces sp. NPDC058672]|uniref:bacteriocin immunity protein n=1 Tax=Streptomyces sp. NPDC058672 TaxID=3346591 RepID=UPI003657EA90
MPPKTRTELIEMVQKLIDATLPEAEEDALLEELKASVQHPRVSDLIFYQEPPLTAEQVVDQALAYRPIEL